MEQAREIINEVKPFKAIHYNEEYVGYIGNCLSEPYDVISDAELEEYYKQCSYNVVRLILNKEQPDDNENNNRYTRARDTFKKWLGEGVLIKRDNPAFWVYEQNFKVPDGKERTVRGFIGRIRLRDYSEGRILPHEKILKKPYEDRVKLTSIAKMQFEYIWGMYRDPEKIIDRILSQYEKRDTFVNFFEKKTSVTHKLWVMEDPEEINMIGRIFEDKKVYIADGHHRYQAMLEVRDRMRKLYPNAGPDAPWEYIIMFLVNTESDGLTVLPTHRVLHDIEVKDVKRLVNCIDQYFHVKTYPFSFKGEKYAREKWINALTRMEKKEHKFGAYIGRMKRYYLLTLKDSEAYEELVDLPYSSDWKLLDVNIINTLVLRRILGLTEEELSSQRYVGYTKDVVDAINSVRVGKNQIALILNPPTVNDIVKIAENGEKMPRKATYFYPKPLSGVVFYSIDPAMA